MFQLLINNRWRLIPAIFIYLVIVVIVWKEMSILEVLDLNRIGEINYWNEIKEHFTIINGIGIVLIFATSSTILASLLFILTYYLRLYQNNLRITFQEIFDFLSLIPCVFWSFMLFLIIQPSSDLSIFENIIVLMLINSFMIFPMLLNSIFKAINSMSDGYIQTGYALGANSFEIAALLVAPKLLKPISIAIILIFTRLFIELAILAAIIGVGSMYLTIIVVVLIALVSGFLVFLLKR